MPLVCMCVVKCGGGSLACDVEGGTGGPNLAEYVHLIQTCGVDINLADFFWVPCKTQRPRLN